MLPLLDEPELNTSAPLDPAAPALADRMNTGPLEVAVPSPLVKARDPPVWTVLRPATTVAIPPAPLVPLPTLTTTAPPRPTVAAPEPR